MISPKRSKLSDMSQNDKKMDTSLVTLVERNPAPYGIPLLNTVAMAKISDPNDLVAMAQEIQKADTFVKATASNKLKVIVDQVRHLQQMAIQILQEAKDNTRLHHAACNFKKVPGNIYHLYKRPSGQTYFSMLSPEEWGTTCPHDFQGSFRLECDLTWTPLEEVLQKDSDMQIIEALMGSKNLSSVICGPDQLLNARAALLPPDL
ncbi:uncharacterized protein C1orf50 homolog isoform X2 [Neocloeon triangulifer]|uniref:uncharacterized protein C1orf50 homolog isoform X2 n=1 Tax=Neocloeon triangulifer TaxID=2078957 RepID=UPI00286F8B2D|nr:uncharacterized protein C1orf50 homolog isoform X2 [Neocloeon triangulifer]